MAKACMFNREKKRKRIEKRDCEKREGFKAQILDESLSQNDTMLNNYETFC